MMPEHQKPWPYPPRTVLQSSAQPLAPRSMHGRQRPRLFALAGGLPFPTGSKPEPSRRRPKSPGRHDTPRA
eukprot:7553769-Lingulodinium_polyedra.AAC.1